MIDGNTVIVECDNGEIREFYLLDRIEENDMTYCVLMDVDNDENIVVSIETEGEDGKIYLSEVPDLDTALKIFNIFVAKFHSLYPNGEVVEDK